MSEQLTSDVNPKFNEFIIYRKIDAFDQMSDGVERLVAAAQHIGDSIFGKVPVGLVRDPDEEKSLSSGIAVDKITPLEVPKTVLYRPSELELRMMELFSPREANLDGKFRFVAERMLARRNRVYSPVSKINNDGTKYRVGNVYASLDRISIMHGFVPTDPIDLHLLGLVQIESPEPVQGTRLSLVLNPISPTSVMLVDQANACRDVAMSASKRVMTPQAPFMLHIPFCEMPKGATADSAGDFISRLIPHIAIARLKAGGVDFRLG